MKHNGFEPALVDELRRLGLCAGLCVGPELSEGLVRYLLAVLEMNKRVNLTRILEPSRAIRLHVLDSLLAIPELEQAPWGPGIDLGSGAGFPGVPLALASGRSFLLLDSVTKKIDAVREALAMAGVAAASVSAEAERAETFAARHPGAYSVVTARAVAPLSALVELASPLLCNSGVLVALKGRLDLAEQESGTRAGEKVGMSPKSRREVLLPGGGEKRTILAYEKSGDSEVLLPRRIGLAQRNPLG